MNRRTPASFFDRRLQILVTRKKPHELRINRRIVSGQERAPASVDTLTLNVQDIVICEHLFACVKVEFFESSSALFQVNA